MAHEGRLAEPFAGARDERCSPLTATARCRPTFGLPCGRRRSRAPNRRGSSGQDAPPRPRQVGGSCIPEASRRTEPWRISSKTRGRSDALRPYDRGSSTNQRCVDASSRSDVSAAESSSPRAGTERRASRGSSVEAPRRCAVGRAERSGGQRDRRPNAAQPHRRADRALGDDYRRVPAVGARSAGRRHEVLHRRGLRGGIDRERPQDDRGRKGQLADSVARAAAAPSGEPAAPSPDPSSSASAPSPPLDEDATRVRRAGERSRTNLPEAAGGQPQAPCGCAEGLSARASTSSHDPRVGGGRCHE